MLDACPTILVNGTDLLIQFKLRVTHKLDVHSCQWFRSAQTLKRETHNLPVDECTAILVSGSDLCMHSNSLAGCVFSLSCQ